MIDLRKIDIRFLVANEGKQFTFTSNITGETVQFEMDEGMINHFRQFPEVLYKLTPNF